MFGGYTLGVLVMSNFGKMHNLRVAGMPVGEVLAEKLRDMPRAAPVVRVDHRGGGHRRAAACRTRSTGSCKRVALGIGRVGSYAAHGSGEIVVGFSTANVIPRRTRKMVYKMKILLDQRLDPLYEAVMEATEEAILNSMCMATPMAGVNGQRRAGAAARRGAALRRRDAADLRLGEEAARPAGHARRKGSPQGRRSRGWLRARQGPSFGGAQRRGHSIPHPAGTRPGRRLKKPWCLAGVVVLHARPRFPKFLKELTMAKSKSKHMRVRHKIRLKWKKRRERKKAAEKATAGKKKK